jgi:hypothetical protein
MTSLEDLSLAQRVILAAATVGLALMLLAVLHTEGQERREVKSPYEERFIELDRKATEAAYLDHIQKLFNVWITDYSDLPPKALKGAQNARSAYARAMSSIDKRERELTGGRQ